MSSPSLHPWPPRNRDSRATILLIEDEPFQAHARTSVLLRYFAGVERVGDAAEAFIKLEKPGFAQSVALIIVGLRMPGPAGPTFVNELTSRIPNVPILVIGRRGEIAPDYQGEHVRFLPHHATSQDVLAGTRQMLNERVSKVA